MLTKKAAAATPTPTASTVVMMISTGSGILVHKIVRKMVAKACSWNLGRP